MIYVQRNLHIVKHFWGDGFVSIHCIEVGCNCKSQDETTGTRQSHEIRRYFLEKST